MPLEQPWDSNGYETTFLNCGKQTDKGQVRAPIFICLWVLYLCAMYNRRAVCVFCAANTQVTLTGGLRSLCVPRCRALSVKGARVPESEGVCEELERGRMGGGETEREFERERVRERYTERERRRER